MYSVHRVFIHAARSADLNGIREIWMIDDVFMALKEMQEVRTASAFSREFLGRESNYWRSLRYKSRDPSADVIVRCAVVLKERGELLVDGKSPEIVQRREKLLNLADDCIEALFVNCGAQPGRSAR